MEGSKWDLKLTTENFLLNYILWSTLLWVMNPETSASVQQDSRGPAAWEQSKQGSHDSRGRGAPARTGCQDRGFQCFWFCFGTELSPASSPFSRTQVSEQESQSGPEDPHFSTKTGLLQGWMETRWNRARGNNILVHALG